MAERRGRDITDPAALVTAPIAVVLALLIPEGAWSLFASIVGLTLVFIFAGYYRSTVSSKWRGATGKALALATVIGLCMSLALAYPWQEYKVRRAIEGRCGLLPSASGTNEKGLNLNGFDDCLQRQFDCEILVPPQAAQSPRTRLDNCLGSVTTGELPLIWLVISIPVVIGYMFWWRGRRVQTLVQEDQDAFLEDAVTQVLENCVGKRLNAPASNRSSWIWFCSGVVIGAVCLRRSRATPPS